MFYTENIHIFAKKNSMYNDSGIYCYKNNINGKLYIGQSVNLKRRYKDFLSKTIYSGSFFQKAIDKYGKENFSYSILTHCKISELNYYEAFYIQRLKTHIPHYGYNLTTGGDSAFQRTELCKKRCVMYGTVNEEKNNPLSKKDVIIIIMVKNGIKNKKKKLVKIKKKKQNSVS